MEGLWGKVKGLGLPKVKIMGEWSEERSFKFMTKIYVSNLGNDIKNLIDLVI